MIINFGPGALSGKYDARLQGVRQDSRVSPFFLFLLGMETVLPSSAGLG